MPYFISNGEEFYFNDLPSEGVDYHHIDYLVLKEASGEKVSWKGISQRDINIMVCRLQDKDFLRGSYINGTPVWAQLKPKGKDRLEVLEKGYNI